MRTIDMMSARDLADLRDAGRGHLIDGASPMLDKADELRKREREEGPRCPPTTIAPTGNVDGEQ